MPESSEKKTPRKTLKICKQISLLKRAHDLLADLSLDFPPPTARATVNS
jgi:hypothetical protein